MKFRGKKIIWCCFSLLCFDIYHNVWCYSRSSDCFSLGWPMRDDGDFFKSTRDTHVFLFSKDGMSSFTSNFFFFSYCYFFARENTVHIKIPEA